jgi:hypothetical protein
LLVVDEADEEQREGTWGFRGFGEGHLGIDLGVDLSLKSNRMWESNRVAKANPTFGYFHRHRMQISQRVKTN